MSSTDFQFGNNTLSASERFEQNIYACWKRATDSDIATGRAWYPTANDIAERLCSGDVESGAGILAAFSPNMGWKQNIELAQECIRTNRYTGHYKQNCRKARKIANGTNPRIVLGGNKTKAFYECILTSGKCAAVCIDRHAVSIALGRTATATERRLERETGKRRKDYDTYAQAYRNVAKRIGLLPSELQAITWVCWRREQGITD